MGYQESGKFDENGELGETNDFALETDLKQEAKEGGGGGVGAGYQESGNTVADRETVGSFSNYDGDANVKRHSEIQKTDFTFLKLLRY